MVAQPGARAAFPIASKATNSGPSLGGAKQMIERSLPAYRHNHGDDAGATNGNMETRDPGWG